MEDLKGFIKVNLPMNKEAFVSGNGEGIWVKVSPEVEKLYNEDYSGGEFKGLLANDSFYYPSLVVDSEITFTMRGTNRPVALFDGHLDLLDVISEEQKIELISNIQANQNQMLQ